MTEFEKRVDYFLEKQLKDWKRAGDHHAALPNVRTRTVWVDGQSRVIQFNPERIRSSAASIDKAALQARPCFFCNRETEQESILFDRNFEILVNPYPIFENHLTIPLRHHDKQQIFRYFTEMLRIAVSLPGYFVFYNGPRCGASAPDHMHFQAGKKGGLPVVNHCRDVRKILIRAGKRTGIYRLAGYRPSVFLIVSASMEEAVSAFEHIYRELKIKPGEYEPMMNVLVWTDDNGKWNICIFPRRELRPSCFYAEGEAKILISPATVEMSGLFITPLEKDFRTVTATDLENILDEVCLTGEEMDKIGRNIAESNIEEQI